MSASQRTRNLGRARVTPFAVAVLLLTPTEAALGKAGKPVTESFPVDTSVGVGFCAGLSTLECGDLFGEGEFVEWAGDQTVWHHSWISPVGKGGWVQLKIDLDAIGIGETTGYVYEPDGETNKFRLEFNSIPFTTTVTTTNIITAEGEPNGFFFVLHADYDVRVTVKGEIIVSTLGVFGWSSECPVGTLYECGNGVCESGSLGEGCTTCSSDCGECLCGDGCCQADEDSASCPDDCTAPGAVCEELSGPTGPGSCTDPTPGNCVCVGCVDDGVCTIDDDCTCADCANDFVCGGTIFCLTDGVCDVFNEGCACPECASAAPACAM